MKKDLHTTKKQLYTLDRRIMYQVEIAGTREDDWSIWIDNLTVQNKLDELGFEKTVIKGELDQAGLLGLIRRLIYLGFPLVSVKSFPVSTNGDKPKK